MGLYLVNERSGKLSEPVHPFGPGGEGGRDDAIYSSPANLQASRTAPPLRTNSHYDFSPTQYSSRGRPLLAGISTDVSALLSCTASSSRDSAPAGLSERQFLRTWEIRRSAADMRRSFHPTFRVRRYWLDSFRGRQSIRRTDM